MQMPPNCPLTPQEFAELPPEIQNSKTFIWVKDDLRPDPETLDRIVAVCNRLVLPAIAPYYFNRASTSTQQQTEHKTEFTHADG